MTTSDLVIQGLDHHLLTHKDYAVEVMEFIIKDKDVDPCADQETEELGVSGLFNLARVRFFFSFLSLLFFMLNS